MINYWPVPMLLIQPGSCVHVQVLYKPRKSKHVNCQMFGINIPQPMRCLSLPGVFHAAHQLLHLYVVYHRVARFRHLTRKSNVVAGQQGRRRVVFLLVGVFRVALYEWRVEVIQ